jgi:hypothetical protein
MHYQRQNRIYLIIHITYNFDGNPKRKGWVLLRRLDGLQNAISETGPYLLYSLAVCLLGEGSAVKTMPRA